MMIANDAELHRAQRAFRSVLDAFARPGTVHEVKPDPLSPTRPAALDGALETLIGLFIDQAVTFDVVGAHRDTLAAYLTGESHARRALACDADFVVIPRSADSREVRDAVLEACCGTLASPEKGAMLLMGCARLEDAAEGDRRLHVVEVRGPGVADVNRFSVDRLGWMRARAQRRDEFPCGVEIVLADEDGRIVAIPRSSRLTSEDVLSQGTNVMRGTAREPIASDRRALSQALVGEAR